MATEPALSVHGGAWDIPTPERDAHRRGCLQAAREGGRRLTEGASALDAVVAAVRALEADGTFDAGVGSVLTREGAVEVDAGLMDGESLRVGAVGAAPCLAHPILVARLLLEEPELSFLVGAAATRFGEEHGVPPTSAAALVSPRERARWEALARHRATVRSAFSGTDSTPPAPRGTVGAVARDRRGHLAAAVSTGGTPFKPSGRVGDTPVVGCGFFADDGLGAVSCTGFGETILRVQLAHLAARMLPDASGADDAARRALELLSTRAAGLGGMVILGARGAAAARWNTPTMAFAHWTPEGVTADCP